MVSIKLVFNELGLLFNYRMHSMQVLLSTIQYPLPIIHYGLDHAIPSRGTVALSVVGVCRISVDAAISYADEKYLF